MQYLVNSWCMISPTCMANALLHGYRKGGRGAQGPGPPWFLAIAGQSRPVYNRSYFYNNSHITSNLIHWCCLLFPHWFTCAMIRIRSATKFSLKDRYTLIEQSGNYLILFSGLSASIFFRARSYHSNWVSSNYTLIEYSGKYPNRPVRLQLCLYNSLLIYFWTLLLNNFIYITIFSNY